VTINLEKLVWDILTAPSLGMPPDPEACKECKFHPDNLQLSAEEEGQWCYMFKNLPDTLCMQFKPKGR
jgi:hypothetical protein